MRRLVTALGAVVIMALSGCAAKASGQPVPTPVLVTVPGPTTTATKIVPGPTKTATTPKYVTRYRVPQDCLDALDNAAELFTTISDGYHATITNDIVGIEASTARVNRLRPVWEANRDSCEAASK